MSLRIWKQLLALIKDFHLTGLGHKKYFLDTESQNTVVSYEYLEAFVLGRTKDTIL